MEINLAIIRVLLVQGEALAAHLLINVPVGKEEYLLLGLVHIVRTPRQ